MESRTSRLDDEIRERRSAADKEAKNDYQRHLTAAEQDAEKTVERSRRGIDGIARAAQQELKPRVRELPAKMAEERIRGEISDADRERILCQFVRTLGGEQ